MESTGWAPREGLRADSRAGGQHNGSESQAGQGTVSPELRLSLAGSQAASASRDQPGQPVQCTRASYTTREGRWRPGQISTPEQEGEAPCSLLQPPEPQVLQAPAQQLASIIHLVTKASGFPAEQERLAKALGSTSLPAPAPFLTGRAEPQTCLADHDGRARLHLLLLPANLPKNLLRGVHWGCIFQDWLPLRAFLQYSCLGYQERVTRVLMSDIWICKRERLCMHSPTCTCTL